LLRCHKQKMPSREGTNRGDQFRGDYEKLYDEGIQAALKYLGE